jgi:hypothetical protein
VTGLYWWGLYYQYLETAKGSVTTPVELVVPTIISVTVTPTTQLLSCYGVLNGTIEATLVSGGQETNYLYTLNYLSSYSC